MKNNVVLYYILLVLILPNGLHATGTPSDNRTNKDINSMGHVPHWFMENKGQVIDQHQKTNESVLYQLSLPGLNVSLKNNGFSYDAWKAEDLGEDQDLKSVHRSKNRPLPHRYRYAFHRVDVDFEGASTDCRIEAEGKAPDYTMYYTTGTPASGAMVFHYQKVVYRNLYTGIDLEFVSAPGTGKPVEYNFIVHPGADISKIRMRYRGALESDLKNGALSLRLAHTTLTENIPASWIQETGKEVNVKYKELAKEHTGITIGFTAETTTKNHTLIIDPIPILEWGTYYGGSFDEFGRGIATDALGNVLVTGDAGSSTGIATTGAYQVNLNGNYDGYIGKMDVNGVRQWGTYFGGPDYDRVLDISADAMGNLVVTGMTSSSSGIATPGSHQPNYGGNTDAYIVKFNTSGARLWSTYYGGSDTDGGNDITTDLSGNILIAGFTGSTNGIASPGAHQLTPGSTLVAKFNGSGLRIWGTYYGGSGYGVATDALENVIVTGSTDSSNFIATPGAHQTTFGGGGLALDGFVVKFDASGIRQWGTFYGGSDFDYGTSVTSDVMGNIYVTGDTRSLNGIATQGAHQTTYAGGSWNGGDAFIVKFNQSGIRQWGTYYGGNGGDIGNSIATDFLGNVLVGGSTSSSNGIFTTGGYQNILGGLDDAFIAKLSTTGVVKGGTYFGGDLDDYGEDITFNQQGSIFITGTVRSWTGIATPGAHQTTILSYRTAFIASFNSCTITSFTTQPADLNTSINSTAVFNVVSPDPNATYQWQTDIGFGFQNLSNAGQYSGTTSPSLAVSNVTLGNNNHLFRCVLTSGACSDTSDVATLTVCGAVTVQPASQTVNINNTVQFITASSDPFATFQWQTDLGFGFQNLNNTGQYSGTTSPTLNIANVTLNNHNQLYRCIVTSASCTDTTNAAVLTVNNNVGMGEVTSSALFSVAPNPANNLIQVTSDASLNGSAYVIRDGVGRTVLTGKIIAEKTVIDLGELPSGVYLLIIGDDMKHALKVVKR